MEIRWFDPNRRYYEPDSNGLAIIMIARSFAFMDYEEYEEDFWPCPLCDEECRALKENPVGGHECPNCEGLIFKVETDTGWYWTTVVLVLSLSKMDD